MKEGGGWVTRGFPEKSEGDGRPGRRRKNIFEAASSSPFLWEGGKVGLKGQLYFLL